MPEFPIHGSIDIYKTESHPMACSASSTQNVGRFGGWGEGKARTVYGGHRILNTPYYFHVTFIYFSYSALFGCFMHIHFLVISLVFKPSSPKVQAVGGFAGLHGCLRLSRRLKLYRGIGSHLRFYVIGLSFLWRQYVWHVLLCLIESAGKKSLPAMGTRGWRGAGESWLNDCSLFWP